MLEQAETFETIISTSRLRNQEKEQIIINPKAKRRRKYRHHKSLPEKTAEKQQKSMKPKPGSETRTIKFINLKTDGSRRKKKDINYQCYKRRRDITTELTELKKHNKRLF